MADSDVLRAPHVLEYPYSRSVGPVIGAFLTGLREGRILGASSRDAQGKATVIVPPTEYDPITGADVGDMVEVGPSGVVTTWSWAAPARARPAPRPPVRVGPHPARRGHHGHAARRRRRVPRCHVDRHAGHGALAPGG